MSFLPLRQIADNFEVFYPGAHGLYVREIKRENKVYYYLQDRYHGNKLKYFGRKGHLSERQQQTLDLIKFSRKLLKYNRKLVAKVKKHYGFSMSRNHSKILRALSSIGAFDKDYILVGTHACSLYKIWSDGKSELSKLSDATQDVDILNISGHSDIFETVVGLGLTPQHCFEHPDFNTGTYFTQDDKRILDVLTDRSTLNYENQLEKHIWGAEPDGIGYLKHKPLYITAPIEDAFYVRVPQPARFALHKYFVSGERKGPHAFVKSENDLKQAIALDNFLRSKPFLPAECETLEEAFDEMPEFMKKKVSPIRQQHNPVIAPVPTSIGADPLAGVRAWLQNKEARLYKRKTISDCPSFGTVKYLDNNYVGLQSANNELFVIEVASPPEDITIGQKLSGITVDFSGNLKYRNKKSK